MEGYTYSLDRFTPLCKDGDMIHLGWSENPEEAKEGICLDLHVYGEYLNQASTFDMTKGDKSVWSVVTDSIPLAFWKAWYKLEKDSECKT